MKILGIIGSVRKDSIHKKIFGFYKDLAGESFELVRGDLDGLPIFNDEDLDHPKAKQLEKMIKESDGVIFFAPEYNYSVSGCLKNAIDWFSRMNSKPLSGVKATIVGASPGAIGTARMQHHLRQIGVSVGIDFMVKPEIMISKAGELIGDKGFSNEKTKDLIIDHAKEFRKFIDS